MIKGKYSPKEHAKKLYEMELHETFKPDENYSISITRVPGGWIFI